MPLLREGADGLTLTLGGFPPTGLLGSHRHLVTTCTYRASFGARRTYWQVYEERPVSGSALRLTFDANRWSLR